MNAIKNLSLVIFSGLLFSIAWPGVGDLSFLLFIAFVPLLILEEKYYQSGKSNLSFFAYSYLGFFIWNAISTWWIYYSSLFGMVSALAFNSLFMSVVFYLFHITRKKVGSRQGYVALVVYWMAWEWGHMQWDLSWPWLTLGNGFANYYKWVQWYEFTGVFGGSLWILLVNVFLFKLTLKITDLFKEKGLEKKISSPPLNTLWVRGIGIALILVIPIIVSHRMYDEYVEIENPINVVVLQPNIDPYNVKFDAPPEELLQKMFSLLTGHIDSTTDYLLFPETALTENIWENDLDSTNSILFIKEFLKKFPRLKIVVGASTYYAFAQDEKLSSTARKFSRGEGYYEAYNTALQIDSTDKIQIYHKSKLVVGVEKMPYPALFKPLENLAIDLGGTSGSLGIQEKRTIFTCNNPFEKEAPFPKANEKYSLISTAHALGKAPYMIGSGAIAPVICYESIYGEFVTDFIKNGADIIFILTNDGWWDNTAGYRQHLAYGRLRAIETRRSIARSANTGISCFINQRGDIFSQTSWWQEEVIKKSINKNSEFTFYTKYGDFLARSSIFIAAILILWTIVRSAKRYSTSQL